MSDTYFHEMHERVKADYTVDGLGVEPYKCSTIAFKLERLLERERRSPQVRILEKTNSRGELLNIYPTPYGGRVEWRRHFICMSAGVVYDPMFPEPVPVDQYLATAFSEPLTEINGYFYFEAVKA